MILHYNRGNNELGKIRKEQKAGKLAGLADFLTQSELRLVCHYLWRERDSGDEKRGSGERFNASPETRRP